MPKIPTNETFRDAARSSLSPIFAIIATSVTMLSGDAHAADPVVPGFVTETYATVPGPSVSVSIRPAFFSQDVMFRAAPVAMR